jgi:hypothetical protein
VKIKELGKGIFESKKRGISDEKIAVIISGDRRGIYPVQQSFCRFVFDY